MAIVYSWLLLTGLLSSAHSINCSFYNSICETNNTSSFYGDDYNCRKKVESCTKKFPGVSPEKLFCYTLHKIGENGSVGAVTKKDCLQNLGHECQTRRCVPDQDRVQHGHMMCCCQGNMCNNVSTIIKPTPTATTVKSTTVKPTTLKQTTKPSQSTHAQQETTEFTSELTTELPSSYQSHGLSSGSNLMLIGLSTVGGVIVLATIFVISFWCWSNRRWSNRGENSMLEDELELNELNMEGSVSSLFPDINFTSLRLIEKIGSGRFSAVWKASLNDNLVAVKIFPEKEKESWDTEKDIYMHPEIKHENLRNFLAAKCCGDESSTVYWMILDYHEMGSLSDYLKSNVLTLENVCKMAGSVAAGLAYLHSEINSNNGKKPAIAHRDVKSRNILVKTDLTCCICDLGLCIKFPPGTSLTTAQGQVGTVRYMAPEVLEGAIMFNRESFLRIDVYALALVIWEMISRCAVKGPVHEYKQPFETEVGMHPNVEQMQSVVVSSRMRPEFPKGWDCIQPFESLAETVEECWDHDAEARLTAQCVEERANMCLRVYTDLAYPTGVSLEHTTNTDEYSSEPHHGMSNGYLEATVTKGGQQQTGGCVQLQQAQAVNGQMRPLDLNKTKPGKPPFYPKNGSSSPPPYSAVPPSCLIPGRQC